MTREAVRRVVIRLATTILMMIVGPGSAWLAGGYSGLLFYIAVIPISTMLAAEFAARTSFSRATYAISPIFLSIAGFVPFFFGQFFVFTIIVPMMMGIYQGFFWCYYHDVRRENGESENIDEGTSTDKWQKLEIFTTLAGVVIATTISVLGHVSIAGLVGGALALVAFLIIPSQNISWNSLGRSTNNIQSNNTKLGVLMTGTYGIMQWATTSTMRIFIFSSSAEFNTGIIGLGAIITISSTIGYVIKNIIDPKSSSTHNENKEEIKNQIAIRNWKYGNAISLASLAVMLYGTFYSTILIIIGYIVFKGITLGVLRPIETHLAGNLLMGEGGAVGLRERMKFRAQVLALILLVYQPILIIVAIICTLFSFIMAFSIALRPLASQSACKF
jgi:hypothetical protein